MNYKIQLHTHTTNSHDGRLSPQQLIDAYRAAGFDGIAITDHDVESDTVSPYPDFLVLNGIELGKSGAQALVIEDKLIVIAHPGKPGFFWRKQDIADYKDYCHLIERYNGKTNRFYHGEADYAETLGIRSVYADDAHDLHNIGHGWIEVEADALTKDAIIEAILAGNYINVTRG